MKLYLYLESLFDYGQRARADVNSILEVVKVPSEIAGQQSLRIKRVIKAGKHVSYKIVRRKGFGNCIKLRYRDGAYTQNATKLYYPYEMNLEDNQLVVEAENDESAILWFEMNGVTL